MPLGAIAFSTMGGNRTVSHTAVTYCKYFLSVVMEAVTMALAIIVCNAFVSAGLPSFTGSYADWAKTLIYLCEMTFTIAMTVGSVKGAQSLTSKECLDVLYRLGISTDRSMAIAKWPHYEKLESDLMQGEIYHNFNGSDYRLMEKYSGRNMLFMDVNSGQFVVGIGVEYFCRYPQGEDRNSDLCETGIEWGHGLYLGNTPSTINFALLRREHGVEKEIDTIDAYRASLTEKFETYYSLAKNEAISDSVREAATNAMYEEFGTGKRDTFLSKRNDGDYDKGFFGATNQEKHRGR